ncbi:MAG: polyprenyl synthetase family protein [Elusimicrobia bacterium]|nr:polyprenyl synthetase family protein [Elusimicrobiota bacterium]
MPSGLASYFETRSRKVEKALDSLLSRRSEEPNSLREAMRYSLFAGGKRLRPVLVIAAAECCGGMADQVLFTACAVEMIHTYSLIHDDLPAMDNDDLRRGKPTCHKVFGEAIAILAGDGLLTLAFELMAQQAKVSSKFDAPKSKIQNLKSKILHPSPSDCIEAIRVISSGAGIHGMVGGQVEDLKAEGIHINGNRQEAQKLLERIHRHKTAALISSCLEVGAVLMGASSKARAALKSYGQSIGLAFQIADDILDVIGDKKKMGKRGSDTKNKKLTYTALHGIEAARAQATLLVQKAHQALKSFGEKAAPLHDLAEYIITRDR